MPDIEEDVDVEIREEDIRIDTVSYTHLVWMETFRAGTGTDGTEN